MVGRWVVAYVLFACIWGLAGCGKGDPSEGGPKATFDRHCASCHARAGEPGGPSRGGSKGPDLSKVGAAPGHTAEWLADYIRDPKSKRAESKMPAFGSKLTDAQIKELAEWLAAQK
jgi:mono/diheme cytochrome c family protein